MQVNKYLEKIFLFLHQYLSIWCALFTPYFLWCNNLEFQTIVHCLFRYWAINYFCTQFFYKTCYRCIALLVMNAFFAFELFFLIMLWAYTYFHNKTSTSIYSKVKWNIFVMMPQNEIVISLDQLVKAKHLVSYGL